MSRDLAIHFEDLHRASADPWATDTSWYEIRKRSIALALLPARRYELAYEPACSSGALTADLADRCGRLLASDGSAAAVDRCRHRVAGRSNVDVVQHAMPGDWPPGRFDLVALCEFGYYLDDHDLDAVIAACGRSVSGGGTLLAVHWRGVADDFRQAGGDPVHERLAAASDLTRLVGYVDDDVRIEVFRGMR